MYKSPIEITIQEIAEQITEQRENNIVMQIQEQTGIKVDRQELVRALAFDREQYAQGLADGTKVLDAVCKFKKTELLKMDLASGCFETHTLCYNPKCAGECKHQCLKEV